jgi:hypothetical protein
MARTNTRADHANRADFRAECEKKKLVCWICGMAIDYDAPFDDYHNDDRFQEDHFWPVSTHPELQHDPANKRPSHAGCNRERGNGAPIASLGTPSQDWT